MKPGPGYHFSPFPWFWYPFWNPRPPLKNIALFRVFSPLAHQVQPPMEVTPPPPPGITTTSYTIITISTRAAIIRPLPPWAYQPPPPPPHWGLSKPRVLLNYKSIISPWTLYKKKNRHPRIFKINTTVFILQPPPPSDTPDYHYYNSYHHFNFYHFYNYHHYHHHQWSHNCSKKNWLTLHKWVSLKQNLFIICDACIKRCSNYKNIQYTEK